MKNNRKKQTSSYLLIFLGIVAALLILIILYLTFFRKDSQSSINLTKNDSEIGGRQRWANIKNFMARFCWV